MKRISILLADDHTFVREGLRNLLAIEPDFAIVGEVADGRAAVLAASKLRPDIILMDIAMPLLNGLEATRQIVTAVPSAKVLILSAHSEDAYIDRAVSAGAAGFLLKQTSALDICACIRDILSGKTRIDSFAGRAKKRSPSHVKLNAAAARLTEREREVLQLIAEGKANKQTAAQLGISIKTVEKHREHLMAKLNIHDTAGLTRHAIATGIIDSALQVTILGPEDE